MIKLKEVIHDLKTNSVGATWVRVITPEIVVPEATAPDTVDEDGNVVAGVVTLERTIPAVEVQIKCHSYADVQTDMFRADIAELGGAVDEALIALVEANIKPPIPPTPGEVAEQELRQAAIGARADVMTDATIKYLTSHTPAEIIAKMKTLLPTMPAAEAAVIGRLASAIGVLLR